jgi:hypothetical protein
VEQSSADARAGTVHPASEAVPNPGAGRRQRAVPPTRRDPLAGVAPGDALVILALVPASTLRPALTPEAEALLRDSLRRVVEEVVPDGATVLEWRHGQFLAVLSRTTRAEAGLVAGEIRRRWHCSWTAPVTVASGVSSVDVSTPPATAAMLAGAEVSASKERAAHS